MGIITVTANPTIADNDPRTGLVATDGLCVVDAAMYLSHALNHYAARFSAESKKMFGVTGEFTEAQKKGLHRVTDPVLVAAQILRDSRPVLGKLGLVKFPGKIDAIRAVLIHGTIQECGLVIGRAVQAWEEGLVNYLDDSLDIGKEGQVVVNFVFSASSAANYIRLHFKRLDAALNNGTIAPADQVDNRMHRTELPPQKKVITGSGDTASQAAGATL